MKLSAPIFLLKRKARLLSREKRMPLHEALHEIARAEGYASWSLLAAKLGASTPAAKLLAGLAPGDVMLIGARPGHGKTLLSLQLAVEAMKEGRRAAYFSLDYTAKDILARFRDIGANPADFAAAFTFDGSEEICATYIAHELTSAAPGTLAVVDYLQVLDQKRTSPELDTQVRSLRAFARTKGVIFVCISQIDRSYDPAAGHLPGLRDVRLPNPLDLALFDKTCFLHSGEMHFSAAA